MDNTPFGPLWLMPSLGGKPQPFSKTVVSNVASWSPDSRELVWDTLDVNQSMNSLRAKAIGGAERDFIQIKRNVFEFTPAWSPNAKQREVAFFSSRKQPLGVWLTKSGGSPRLIAHFQNNLDSGAMPNPPIWSPDGRWLAAERAQEKDDSVWTYAREGSRSYLHGRAGYVTRNPTWSFDSRRLSYIQHRPYDGAAAPTNFVIIADRDGTGRHELWKAPGGARIHSVSWSPRGEDLLVLVVNESSRMEIRCEIWRLDTRSHHAQQLLNVSTEWPNVSWMSNGKGFYFVKTQNRESHVWRAIFAR
jgi:Tol biopolymer transport system component